MPLRLQNGTVCYGVIDVAGYVLALIKLCQLGRHDTIVVDVPRKSSCVSRLIGLRVMIASVYPYGLHSCFPSSLPLLVPATDDIVGAIEVRAHSTSGACFSLAG